MDIREMRKMLGATQIDFAVRYNIPFRTVQNWESGVRKPPEYIVEFLGNRVQADLVNRKTVSLPVFDSHKKTLPPRSEYVGAFAWLKAVRDALGEDVVFALDEALMCQGRFAGRSDEFLVWAYGPDRLAKFNGLVVLGNRIGPYNVQEKDGIRFTDFNRTLTDALDNESILDMQGITEAVSHYYYSNNESFSGIYVPPQHQERFEILARDAIEYYDD